MRPIQRPLPLDTGVPCPACGALTSATRDRRPYCASCDVSWAVMSPRERVEAHCIRSGLTRFQRHRRRKEMAR
jgi:hypothetical protein